MRAKLVPILTIAAAAVTAGGKEYHVAATGNDVHSGTKAAPLRTIQRAADLAQAGDIITVHEGVYRERINPPRGGESDKKRIVYRAARGEKVEIKGSEAVKNWVKVRENVWKAILPNSLFGGFNPYTNLIRGDWFDRRGRDHHTGAVYLEGDWLIEATKLEEVLEPIGTTPRWLRQGRDPFFVNIAWLRPGGGATNPPKIPATRFTARHGTTNAPCSEGGECLGWITDGDWARYDQVDFGESCGELEIRAASAAEGGTIEIRLDAPDGELLGTCSVPNTGGWQSWSSFKAKFKPLNGLRKVCLVFQGRRPAALEAPLWFAQVDPTNTTIWAQFKDIDPNARQVEINVRQTVFYPDQPGRNYITVRGFTLRDAATPWAPPTAEQIGLIGTHWSKGWVIEDNVVSHSVCSGIALGKHGDQYDNTSANSAEGYVKTIERAHARGWTRENIGHHVVRNNTISHCEQAGVVGSLGAAFSTVTGNVIHDIHVRRLFSGAEMAGIKFHAAIDSVISHNHIYRTCLGLWLDWMAQGTRVSGNLFHDNRGEDMFVEVNHGPFVVDNNLFLSGNSLRDMSEGGAYAHNLFAGRIVSRPEPDRETPYHPAHSTTVAGLARTKGGDNRFYNNLFVGNGEKRAVPPKPADKKPQWISGYGLWMYEACGFPLITGGNVYCRGAEPYPGETNHMVLATTDPKVKLSQEDGRYTLQFEPGSALRQAEASQVTGERLGKPQVAAQPYENADGSTLKISTDYSGRKRSKKRPTPGPFERPPAGGSALRVW